MTRAGGGTVRTTSRWISPNGTRSRRDSYCHAVSRSTSVRAFACDVAGRYGTLWKCTNTTRQPRFIIRHAATGESMPPESSAARSEEHTSELQSRLHLVCRLLLEKKKKTIRKR